MSDTKIGRQFTFDSFEVTKANNKAFEAAKKFAEIADSKPLALFGGTATGKTHLLYAVKNKIEQNDPEHKVILNTTAEIQDHLTHVLQNGGTGKNFREKYLRADILLIDDIQEIAGKEKTQKELILIFNQFYESGKRIMMTSSTSDDKGIIERLRSRFFFGDSVYLT